MNYKGVLWYNGNTASDVATAVLLTMEEITAEKRSHDDTIYV